MVEQVGSPPCSPPWTCCLTKQALLIASAAPERFKQDILECTAGILFMATPNAGADLSDWIQIVLNLSSLSKTSQEMLGVLKPRCQLLATLQQQFHLMLSRRVEDKKPTFKIFCVYEELAVAGIGVVRLLQGRDVKADASG